MAEKSGWMLTISDYDFKDTPGNPLTTYYIRKENAVAHGAILLKEMLEAHYWDDARIPEVIENYWRFMNNKISEQTIDTNVDPFFENNELNIELAPIFYEDEAK
jgi:hypothetical protein